MNDFDTEVSPQPDGPWSGGLPGVRAGSIVGNFRIEEEIGRGGMGLVYRARDLGLDREVALKILLPTLAGDPSFRARFSSEVRVAATLESPYVLPVYQAGDSEGRLFMAMPLMRDGDLGDWLADRGSLSINEAVLVLGQLASALDSAHQAGLIHRDVKPGNVLIETDGDSIVRIRLADFGLSKAYSDSEEFTATGDVVGSPEYMSPEQIEGDQVGPASDQYSLACLAFKLLYGYSPFVRESRAGMLVAHLNDEPMWPRENTPVSTKVVREVLDRALSKSPGRRYASCTEFVSQLFPNLRGVGALAPLTPTPPVTVTRGRHRWLVPGAILTFLSLLGLVVTAVLVLSSDSTGSYEERVMFRDHDSGAIASVGVDGSDRRVLSEKVDESTDWVISDDGRLFAYESGGQFTVASTFGSGETKRFEGREPVFTHDSKVVCSTVGSEFEPEAKCEDVRSGEVTRVVAGQAAFVTADDRYLVLAPTADTGQPVTRVAQLSGGEPVELADGRPLGVSADGRVLVTREGGERVPELCMADPRTPGDCRAVGYALEARMDLEGNAILAGGPQSPAASPLIKVATSIPLDGREPFTFYKSDMQERAQYVYAYPTLSPDVAGVRSKGEYVDSYFLMSLDPNPRSSVFLWTSEEGETEPNLTRDGRQVVFASTRSAADVRAEGTPTIVVEDINTKNAKDLASGTNPTLFAVGSRGSDDDLEPAPVKDPDSPSGLSSDPDRVERTGPFECGKSSNGLMVAIWKGRLTCARAFELSRRPTDLTVPAPGWICHEGLVVDRESILSRSESAHCVDDSGETLIAVYSDQHSLEELMKTDGIRLPHVD